MMTKANDLSVGDIVFLHDLEPWSSCTPVATVVSRTPATVTLGDGVSYPGCTAFVVAQFANEEESV